MYQLLETQLSTIKEIAICHQECFPNSFSSKLHNSYLTKTLEWFLASDNRFLFHIEAQNQVIGYCGGFKSSFRGDGSTSGMLQYAMKEAIMGIIKKPNLIFHRELRRHYPLIAKNIFKKIFRSKRIQTIATDCVTSNSKIGLVVIGVHPDYRGKGVFELLMKNFEEESKKRGAREITLSVKSLNARAIAAY
ncbi:MAG TPA: GNAT family N-acetyltransferase, partial [Chitinophagaceae bacterium]